MGRSSAGAWRLFAVAGLAVGVAGCASSISTHRVRPAIHTAQTTHQAGDLSNAGPQVGKGFNQSVWKDMEMALQDWVVPLGDFWTISGVLYHDPAEDDPDTADGMVEIQTIGAGAVEVPTHFYKIVIWEDDGERHAMAVVMANKKYPASESFRTHIVPMRWIEERLDVDFLPELEPVDQDALEVEAGMPYELPE